MSEECNKETILKVEHLKKYFPLDRSKDEVVKAVDDVSFNVQKGQIVGIVGESGCGKSTLGRCIMNLTTATEGKVIFRGENLYDLPPAKMKEMRRNMQMVFQNPYSSFNPRHIIGKSLMDVGLEYGMSKADTAKRLEELLKLIELDPIVLTRRPSELSGGQLQRLAIARALVVNPEFILADEAVSALDVSVQAQILNMLMDLRKEFNLTMLFISHDLTVIEHISDYIVVMYLGRIVEMGNGREIFNSPAHPYTKALLSAKPRERPDQNTKRIILKGDVPNAVHIPANCRFCNRCPEYKKEICDHGEPILTQISGTHYAACAKNRDKAE